VQAFASLQLLPSALAGVVQTPVEVLQVPAAWQASLGEQVTVLLPTHTSVDWLQASVCVQALPSLQVVCSSQLPAPSQFPVFPHWVVDAVQPATVERGGEPLAMERHCPVPQAWHAPVQGELQHTLSTQFPLSQSVPISHFLPTLSLSPQLLVTRLQVVPTQSAFFEHVFRQVVFVESQA
jgi:hypothetical protein